MTGKIVRIGLVEGRNMRTDRWGILGWETERVNAGDDRLDSTRRLLYNAGPEVFLTGTPDASRDVLDGVATAILTHWGGLPDFGYSFELHNLGNAGLVYAPAKRSIHGAPDIPFITAGLQMPVDLYQGALDKALTRSNATH